MSNVYSPTFYPNGIDATNPIGTGLINADDISVTNITDVNSINLTDSSHNAVSTTMKIVRQGVSANQLKGLRGSAIVLLPSPGAGKFNLIENVMFNFVWNSVAYTVVNAGPFPITQGGVTMGSALAAAAFFTATNSVIYTLPTPTIFAASNPTALVDNPLLFTNAGAADLLAGDSTLNITVWYQTFTV